MIVHGSVKRDRHQGEARGGWGHGGGEGQVNVHI